jgi:replicative DNA helicase
MKNITAPEYWAEFSERQQSPVDAVPTHLPGLNRACRDDGGGEGLARGWFVTVGANPGFGKSALALNLSSAASRHGESVGYVSLEMSDKQLASRFYSIHARVPIAKVERGGFDLAAFEEVKARTRGLPPIFVPATIGTDWTDVTVFVRECFEAGCRWFVLDYLQLVQAGDDESINRAITEVTTDLRTWAVNVGAVVVVLSQFNRQTSSEYRLRPRSQGLWGGMILEASSDLVLLLDHSRYVRDGSVARTWLVIDKNRHGPVGEIPVLWDYRTLRMTEAMPDEEHAWPK